MASDLVSSLVARVNVARLRSDVGRLATGERHSLYSPPRHAEAVSYISAVFDECGLATRQDSFKLGNRVGINIVGCKAGASLSQQGHDTGLPGIRGFAPQDAADRLPLLVSAHYDTVPGSPGADDNASGVAVLLECARALSEARLRRSVEFVAFDMEEDQPEGQALVGSTALLKAAGGTGSYEALYNLEMVGFTCGPGAQGHPPGFPLVFPSVYEMVRRREFRGDFIAVVALGSSIGLGRRFQDAAKQWVPGLEVMPIEMESPIPGLLDIFRSDHAPFWLAGVPAIMITDTANFRNPNYHRPSDTLDTLDYNFMGDVAAALVAAVAHHGEVLTQNSDRV